jgi:hypothetical protein
MRRKMRVVCALALLLCASLPTPADIAFNLRVLLSE